MSPEVTTIIVGMIAAVAGAIIGAAVDTSKLFPRAIDARLRLSEETRQSQLEGEKEERNLRNQERQANIEAYKAITDANKIQLALISKLGASIERFADADEATEKQSASMSKAVGANTEALSANTGAMDSMGTTFQVSLTQLITEGSIPVQRIEKAVAAIKTLLEILAPIIRSIPENMAVINGLREVRAASDLLVEQAIKTPVADEDKQEAGELVDAIIKNVGTPPVSDAVVPA